jgi:nucleotide-binding universal stress UspA family protein
MKILLAVDASTAGQTAVDEVARRPWPTGTQVEVLTVIEICEPWALSAIIQELQSVSHKLAGDAAATLQSRGLQASAVVAQGDPKTTILDHAGKSGADLIIVGAHGMGAVDRFLLGSVSRALLRHASCSVQIVRPRPVPGSSGFKVLLAVDGSEGSRHAAEAMAARPWHTGSEGTEFRVLSVVELGMSALQAAFEIPALDSAHLQNQRAAAMERAEKAVDEARAILDAAGLRTSPAISVLVASPKEIILQEAAEWPADLVVLGSHGSGGFTRFLLGSTSEAVATHATCSVEVVRGKI